MKKVFLFGILVTGLTYGQYFETVDESEQSKQSEQPGFFTDIEDIDMGSYPGSPPDQGEDNSPGNPGQPRPIDDWLWILPLAGMILGYRFLRNKNKESIQYEEH